MTTKPGHPTAQADNGYVAIQPTTGAFGRKNRWIERIAAREFTVGPFSFVRNNLNARALGGSKLDFVIIDMEHSPFDMEAAGDFIWNMRAVDASFPVTPLIRVPTNGREVAHNQWLFKQALDIGAMGIMVPQINSAEEARAAVVAMRYPPSRDDAAPEPRGERGVGGAPAAWGLAMPDYVARADLWPLDPQGELLLVVQIETAQAIDSLEDILSVPGVCAAFLGPSDLHADMGYPGQNGVPEVEEKIREAGAKAQVLGAYMGIIGGAADYARRRDEGFMFISGSDYGLSAGLSGALAALVR